MPEFGRKFGVPSGSLLCMFKADQLVAGLQF